MSKEKEIEKLGDLLVEAFGRDTFDKFIEDEEGNLKEIALVSIRCIAEELYKQGVRLKEEKNNGRK